MPSPPGEPWAIYTRISYVRRKTTEGKTVVDALGVERQEPPARELVERKGGQVVKVFVDNDRSAFKGDRPDFETMLEWARSGRIKGIAAWDADRLTRDPDRDNARIIELAERYGVQLATVTGEYDLATSSGKMMFRIAGALARRESEHRSERMLLKFDELAEAGLPKGTGKRPFGFERDGLTVREAEASLLREAAGRLLDRGELMSVILADWRGRGVTAVMGEPFTTTSLRRALISPRSAGLRQHRGEVVGKAAWPAILTLDQHERLKALFVRPERKRQGRPRTYLYSGLLVCGWPDCGKVMVGASAGARKGPFYACKGGRGDADHKGCGRTWITAPTFDQVMTEAVIQYVCGPKFARVIARRLEALHADDVTAEQVEQDHVELAELGQVLGTRFATDAHRQRHAELLARVRQAERRLAAAPEVTALLELPRVESELRDAWEGWLLEERRRRIASVLDHVVIEPRGRGRRFDESRIVPRWKE